MANNKMNPLGKGLKALLPASEDEENLLGNNVTEVSATDKKYFSCPIEFIQPNPYQPRTEFNQEELEGLSKSIREKGILQPLVVRKIEHNSYELIAGERRLRAAKKAELEKVPVIVKDIAISDRLELALIENIQRQNLNALEEAVAYAQLMDEFGLTQDIVSKRVGKSRSAIANSVRILQLPDYARQSLASGTISAGHGRVLLSINDENIQRTLYDEIINRELSVRETETLAKRIKSGSSLKKVTPSPIIPKDQCKKTTNSLHSFLGVKSKIVQKGKKGKLEIEYSSPEELDRVVNLILNIQE